MNTTVQIQSAVLHGPWPFFQRLATLGTPDTQHSKRACLVDPRGGKSNQTTDLEILRAGLVEFALVHLEHGVEDHGGTCEPDARAAYGNPHVTLHGV